MLISAHAGYQRWLGSGADFIEIDIRRDRRGVIVDSHDEPEPGDHHTTLDEILNVAAGRTGLHLDLKERGFEVELLGRVLERFPAHKVVVTPDYEDSALAIKRRFPHVRVSPIDFVTLDQKNPIPAHGRPVWIWTVDDQKRIEQLLGDPRIECLITNRPDLAMELRSARA